MSCNELVVITANWVLHVFKIVFLPTKCLNFLAPSLNDVNAFCNHVRHEGAKSINWIILLHIIWLACLNSNHTADHQQVRAKQRD